MNIEKLIPDYYDRDVYIKELLDVEYIGLTGEHITFKFKTDKEVKLHSILVNEDGTEIIHLGENVYEILNKNSYLTKKDLLKTWKVEYNNM